MIKQLVAIAAAGLLCVGANAALKDGTYEGQGKGNASVITVQVQVTSGKIASVKVVKHGETAMLIDAAAKKITKDAVGKIDTSSLTPVTGASNSSKGIITAINDALSKAK